MELETIRRLHVEARGRGITELIGQLGQLKESHEGVAVATEKTRSASLSASREMEQLVRKYHGEAQAAKMLEVELAKLERTRAQGLVTAAQYNVIRQGIEANYHRSVQAARLQAAANVQVTATTVAQTQALGGLNLQMLATQRNATMMLASLAPGRWASVAALGLTGGPGGWLVAGLTAATAAAAYFWGSSKDGADRANESLREHERLIALVRRQYGDQPAGDARWREQGPQTTWLEATDNLKKRVDELQAAAKRAAGELQEMHSALPGTAGMFGEMDVAPKFAPFAELIRSFMADLERGQPNVRAFREEIAGMGKENEALRETASEINKIFRTEGVEEFVLKVEDARGALERLKAGDRAEGLTAAQEQQRAALEDQLAIVSQITVADRLRAQEAANIRRLTEQQWTMQEAVRQAKLMTAAAEAQINSAAQAQLITLQDQYLLASAVTGEERMRAQQIVTANALIRQGVNEMTAYAVAAQQVRNVQAQIDTSIKGQIIALRQQRELIHARALGEEGSVAAAHAYENAIRAGATAAQAAALAAEMCALYAERAAHASGEFAGNMRAASSSSFASGESWFGGGMGGTLMGLPPLQEGFRWSSRPRPGGGFLLQQEPDPNYWQNRPPDPLNERIERRVDSILGSRRGTLQGAIDDILKTYRSTWYQEAPTTVSGLLDRLGRENPQQAVDTIERMIDRLSGERRTLARDDAIHSLTEQLRRLRESTDALNSTMQIGLDPIYSQGRQALIGYYRAQTGMVAQVGGAGQYSGDQIPVRMLLSQGELLRVWPKGQWDSNDVYGRRNGGQVVNNYNYYQSFNFPEGTDIGDRRTLRQIQDGFGRAGRYRR